MTRLTLRNDVLGRLARDDVDFDSILRVAEAEIARDVRLVRQERFIPLMCSGRLTPLPDDFLEVRALWKPQEDFRQLTYRPLTTLYTSDPERPVEAGLFSLQGSDTGWNLVLAPEPTAEAPVALHLVYHSRIPPLVEGDDTNVLLKDHYDVYVWSCMAGAGTWLEDDELASTNRARRDAAVESIRYNELSARLAASAGLVGSGNPRDIV